MNFLFLALQLDLLELSLCFRLCHSPARGHLSHLKSLVRAVREVGWVPRRGEELRLSAPPTVPSINRSN